MKKILLCAFDPFGGEAINPALLAVEKLTTDCAELCKLEVPTVFLKSVQRAISKIDAIRPDAVIMVGQAGGRKSVTPERVAINVSDARIPDNEGNAPVDEPISKDGPAAYFSTLPIKEMVRRMREKDIPAAVSDSAGTFVCNHLMYGVLDHISKKKYNVPAGFIHIPYVPCQTENKEGVPSLPLEVSCDALRIAVECVADMLEAADGYLSPEEEGSLV